MPYVIQVQPLVNDVSLLGVYLHVGLLLATLIFLQALNHFFSLIASFKYAL